MFTSLPPRRPKRTLRMALMLLMVPTLGCQHLTYSSGLGHSRSSKSGTNQFFLFGLVNTAEVDLRDTCPTGVGRLVVHQSFVDGLLAAITLGIYTPRSWEVWCAGQTQPHGSAAVSKGKEVSL